MGIFIANCLNTNKATNITCLDVRESNDLFDIMVIATALNDRHAKRLVDEVEDGVKKQFGIDARAIEGANTTSWALIDFGDCLVHIFLEDSRDFYRLDQLWNHATPVELNLNEEKPTP